MLGSGRNLGIGCLVFLLALGCRGYSQSDDRLVVSVDSTPGLGDKNAQVAILEFGDYQCPYCAQHATQTLPQLVSVYIETGRVRYFFKDAPIEAIHPLAFKAAEAVQCAGKQGKYWQLHDRLFRNQNALTVPDLLSHAAAIQLEVPLFERCLSAGTFAPQIRMDVEEAKKHGVNGTPYFYLGTLDSTGRNLTVSMALRGAAPFADFQRALDYLLSPPKAGSQR
jgi:protein-disulfide isomerase